MDNTHQESCQFTSNLNLKKDVQIFDDFINANTTKDILTNYDKLCEFCDTKPDILPQFYPKLKEKFTSWRPQSVWKKLDKRANDKCYSNGNICSETKVLVVGAGPSGLRTAIEAQLLGAKVVVVEKRDCISRNNVLHLWRFVIEDLKALGAKKFFGKFCSGSIDHISIRQLQCILLKIALLLGVEFHANVCFEKLIEPEENNSGWKAQFKSNNHPISEYEFDVIIGAFGKKENILGFKRNEIRGKLAIAITANFVHYKTDAAKRAEEISGVSRIYKQNLFKELYDLTGIDLENIVYYKDDTHYFIMTAKKSSLLNKGVLRDDYSDAVKLLATDNVNKDALKDYAQEAAEFITRYDLPLEYITNQFGQPDVAMFDFTCMYQAENASRIIERHGRKLLVMLVGDSLIEPFWPTGSGCARGFLSSLDAAWAIRAWGDGEMQPLEVIAERESIYHLLAQTTQENLNKDYKFYTLDPSTRYPNLNKNALTPQQVANLLDSDNSENDKLQENNYVAVGESKRRKYEIASILEDQEYNKLLKWTKKKLSNYEEIEISDRSSLNNGKIICAIIHSFRPDLINYNSNNIIDNMANVAFEVLEKEMDITPITPEEQSKYENNLNLLYLYKIYQKYNKEEKNRNQVEQIDKKIEIMPDILEYTKLKLTTNANKNIRQVKSSISCKKESSLKRNDYYFKRLNEKVKDKYVSSFNKNHIIKNQNNGENVSNNEELCIQYYKRVKTKRLTSTKRNDNLKSKDSCNNNEYIKKLRILRKIMRKYYNLRKEIVKNDNTTNDEIKSAVKVSSNNQNERSVNELKVDESNKSCNKSQTTNKSAGNNLIAPENLSEHNIENDVKSDNKINTIYKKENCAFDNISSNEILQLQDNITQKLETYESSFVNILENNSASETSVEKEFKENDFDQYETNVKMIKLEKKIPSKLYNLTENNDELNESYVTISKNNAVENDAFEKLSKRPDIIIRSVENMNTNNNSVYVTEIKYWTKLDRVSITPKTIKNLDSNRNYNQFNNEFKCQKFVELNKLKVSSLCQMSEVKMVTPDRRFERVNNWLKHCDFQSTTECSLLMPEKNDIIVETNIQDKLTDITSITKEHEKNLRNICNCNLDDNEIDLKKAQPLLQIKSESSESIAMLKKNLTAQKPIKKHTNISPWELYHGRLKSRSEPPNQFFTTILEKEEVEGGDTLSNQQSKHNMIPKTDMPTNRESREAKMNKLHVCHRRCFHEKDNKKHRPNCPLIIFKECKCKKHNSNDSLGLRPVSSKIRNDICMSLFLILMFIDYLYFDIFKWFGFIYLFFKLIFLLYY